MDDTLNSADEGLSLNPLLRVQGEQMPESPILAEAEALATYVARHGVVVR